MKKNISIDQSVGLVYENQYFDLHNSYDFKEFHFDVHEKVFCLKFQPHKSESSRLKSILSIKFVGVDYIELSQEFVSKVNCNVSEIGYKSPGDTDYDWLLREDNSSPEDHLVFRFEEDQYVRIHSRLVTVECE